MLALCLAVPAAAQDLGSMLFRMFLTDGRVLTLALSDYPGFRTRPQTWEAAVAKFTTLAGSHVADTVLAEIASAVRELEHITVAELTRLLGSAGTRARSSTLDAA